MKAPDQTQRPHATVSRSGPHIVIWPNDTSSAEFRVGAEEVLSFDVQAGVDGLGTFTIALAPRETRGPRAAAVMAFHRWADVWRRLPRLSAVSIGYDMPGGIMLGLITGVSVTRSRVNGALSVQLRGEGLGRLLAQDTMEHAVVLGTGAAEFKRKLEAVLGQGHPIFRNVLGAPTTLGPVEPGGDANDPQAARTLVGQGVKDLVDWVLDNAPSMRVPVLRRLYGGSGHPRDVFSTSFSVTTWNDARVWADAFQSYNGDLYGYIKGSIDEAFYEVFVDTFPLEGQDHPAVELIVRPRPFDTPTMEILPVAEQTGITWEDLRTRYDGLEHHEIGEDDTLEDTLGWDLAEVATFYTVTCDNDLSGSVEAQDAGLAYPAIDLYGLLTGQGLRASRATMRLLGADLAAAAAGQESYTTEQATQVVQFRNRLFNWHRWNPWFVKGTITVRGRDRYRPGEKYLLPWALPPIGLDDPRIEPGLTFYGTSVGWRWSVGTEYTCTITLSRGHSASMLQAIRDEVRSLAPADNPDMVAAV